jgi:predicted secreted hydrolase
MKQRLRAPIGLLIGCLLSLFLASCSFPGVYSSNEQLSPEQPVPPAAQLPPIRFPQDEAAHRDLTEWWYYTGHFQTTEPGGKIHHYGFEFVVFQALRSDLPPVYASHFAISDIDRAEFHYDQRRQLEPDAAIPNGSSTQGINVGIGDWQIQGLNGRDHLRASMQNYAIDLNLQARKPPTLHNGNGLITYGIGGFSYYYSRTNILLSGTLLDHNQPLQVSGQAWMDHQWGNFLTLGGGGWDWYSIQLNNQSEMMVYFIRDASGKTLSTYIGYIDPSGKDFLLPASSIKQTVLERWTSPATGITYPSGWTLDINDPHLRTTLTITPQLKNQELVAYQSTGNTYWEGSVDIQARGPGATVFGKGYVELTGYTKS